jgi:predicted component of type VI protein secretion system
MKNFEYAKLFLHCESAKTRNGFKHTATLYNGGDCMNNATAYCYNRTWEVYTYQTVILNALRNEIDRIITNAIKHIKSAKNFERLNASRRAYVVFVIMSNTPKTSYLSRLIAAYNHFGGKYRAMTLQDAIARNL